MPARSENQRESFESGRRRAVESIARAVEQSLGAAESFQLASVARLLALVKVELLLTDLEESKQRAVATLKFGGNAKAPAPQTEYHEWRP